MEGGTVGSVRHLASLPDLPRGETIRCKRTQLSPANEFERQTLSQTSALSRQRRRKGETEIEEDKDDGSEEELEERVQTGGKKKKGEEIVET